MAVSDIVARSPRALLPVGVALMALAALYAALLDQGLLASQLSDAAASSGGMLHEVFHDARHLLAVPCH